jgi:osmotically-inducible protein OsmY
VSALALELDVKLEPHHQRTDSEIAGAIEHALRWNTHVPADRIRVTVERGHVTLTGEVEWNQQRLRAETVAHMMIAQAGSSEAPAKVPPDEHQVTARSLLLA